MSNSVVINLTHDDTGLWYVPVQFAQSGHNDQPFDCIGQMILDTGSAITVFDESALLTYLPEATTTPIQDPLVLEGITGDTLPVKAEISVLTFCMGGLVCLPATTYPVADVVKTPQVLGIIGRDILDKFTHTINPTEKTLTLEF